MVWSTFSLILTTAQVRQIKEIESAMVVNSPISSSFVYKGVIDSATQDFTAEYQSNYSLNFPPALKITDVVRRTRCR